MELESTYEKFTISTLIYNFTGLETFVIKSIENKVDVLNRGKYENLMEKWKSTPTEQDKSSLIFFKKTNRIPIKYQYLAY